jgi:hypothetical protein
MRHDIRSGGGIEARPSESYNFEVLKAGKTRRGSAASPDAGACAAGAAIKEPRQCKSKSPFVTDI